jgi:hypothetical protein
LLFAAVLEGVLVLSRLRFSDWTRFKSAAYSMPGTWCGSTPACSSWSS